MRLPTPSHPPGTSSTCVLKWFYEQTQLVDEHACWKWRRACRNWEEPAFKLIAPGKLSISSTGQSQTHLQPITHTHTLTQVKRDIKNRQTFDLWGHNTHNQLFSHIWDVNVFFQRLKNWSYKPESSESTWGWLELYQLESCTDYIWNILNKGKTCRAFISLYFPPIKIRDTANRAQRTCWRFEGFKRDSSSSLLTSTRRLSACLYLLFFRRTWVITPLCLTTVDAVLFDVCTTWLFVPDSTSLTWTRHKPN